MSTTTRTWWNRENRPYDPVELKVDAAVHLLGLTIALLMGAILIYLALISRSPINPAHLSLYVGSLLAVLSISMVFNQWPPTPFKMHLARLDQASIFLFMAGSYTPFLALLTGTPKGPLMMTIVWGAAVIGIALKLIAPHRFGRIAIVLYLGIGWSGLIVFRDLARHVTDNTLFLLLAGGIVYSLGIIFHLWEKLRFQNALWHVTVVAGASLHLLAVMEILLHR
ncbi:hemolysin III [Devosia sp. UYZn731]|uniref:PAQR family membrane homeostasis protein TrhA n=1 Tax=Devosia sp. UYZn731 TaxID=3156345 RepID=UPI003394B38F